MNREVTISCNTGYYNILDNLPKNIKNSEYSLYREGYNEVQMHGYRVADMTVSIAANLGLNREEISAIRICSIFHDIGKLYINPYILNKPSKLTDKEYNIIKDHVKYSEELLALNGYPEYSKIVLYHHEKIDGSGYYGLKGNEIPLISKIIGLADVYDALRSNRAYRKAKTKEEALEIIDQEKHKYDKQILDIFFKLYGNKNQKTTIERNN